MTTSAQIRDELILLLESYVSGTASLSDVLDFEASVAHDSDLPPELSKALASLALVGEEIDAEWRPASDFEEVVRQALDGLLNPTELVAAD